MQLQHMSITFVLQSDDGAPSYSGQREPRSNNRPMNRARMEEMAAILSNQDLAENDLMGAIKIIKADSDDTAEEVTTRAVGEKQSCHKHIPALWSCL